MLHVTAKNKPTSEKGRATFPVVMTAEIWLCVNAEKMSNDVDEDDVEDMDYEGEAEDDYEEDEEFEGFILICLDGPVHQS